MQLQSDLKSNFLIVCLLTGIILFCTAGIGNATISDSGNISLFGSNVGTFRDDNTSLTWLDLNSFYGSIPGPYSTESYNSWKSKLVGTGFHVATAADMAALISSTQGDSWSYDAQVMGATDFIWGFYDSNDLPASMVKYSDANKWLNLSIGSGDDPVGSLRVPEGECGIWTVSDNALSASVPEPATMLLFGAGLAGLGLMRKRIKV